MTVVCMDCKKTLGEKCSECGAVAIELGDPLDSERRIVQVRFGSGALDAALWICTNRACLTTYFPEGVGGVSHGLCNTCCQLRLMGKHVTADPVHHQDTKTPSTYR
ncbi:MAG: hypothetical protein ABSF73_03100 [Terriglobia bacterium]